MILRTPGITFSAVSELTLVKFGQLPSFRAPDRPLLVEGASVVVVEEEEQVAGFGLMGLRVVVTSLLGIVDDDGPEDDDGPDDDGPDDDGPDDDGPDDDGPDDDGPEDEPSSVLGGIFMGASNLNSAEGGEAVALLLQIWALPVPFLVSAALLTSSASLVNSSISTA